DVFPTRPAPPEADTPPMPDRKKCGEVAAEQDNFPRGHLLKETSYVYGVVTRGSSAEDGT
ncbi:hypothetical protein PYK79_44645, partial [Streptomyces sp. ID05-04B]|nr:hypothetical protein [Streptomyces sp. ID05-04B]